MVAEGMPVPAGRRAGQLITAERRGRVANSIATRLLDRDGDTKSARLRTARFICATVVAAFLFALIGSPAAPAATPPATGGPPPGLLERRAGISIVGGTATTIQEWPWQVALTLSPSSNAGNALDRQVCGGSLVTPRIVLSAAHCFFDSGSGSWDTPSRYAIVSGRTRLSSDEGVEVPVDDYFYLTDGSGRQLYNPNSNAWDVVVVRLSQPVSSESIKLANAAESRLWAGGREAFATGWGTANQDADRDVLQQVSLSIVDDKQCRDQWGADTSVMLCAFAPGRDTCSGGSGGPLVVAAGGGKYRLVGDVSYGRSCGSGGVYGRLSGSCVMTSHRRAERRGPEAAQAASAAHGNEGAPQLTAVFTALVHVKAGGMSVQARESAISGWVGLT
jgi:secreted trypsin-like serine protease